MINYVVSNNLTTNHMIDSKIQPNYNFLNEGPRFNHVNVINEKRGIVHSLTLFTLSIVSFFKSIFSYA